MPEIDLQGEIAFSVTRTPTDGPRVRELYVPRHRGIGWTRIVQEESPTGCTWIERERELLDDLVAVDTAELLG